MRFLPRLNYGAIARFYDLIDGLSTNKVTQKSRNAFLGELPFLPKKPLIVGCGTGSFACSFVKKVQPPVIFLNDTSQEMLKTAVLKLKKIPFAGKIETIEGPLKDNQNAGGFDFVSLNYILSIFPPKKRPAFLKPICEKLAPEGILQMADFFRPRSFWLQPLFYLNWFAACLFFLIFSFTPPNTLGNPEEDLRKSGFKVIRFKPFLGGLYASWLFKKGA